MSEVSIQEVLRLLAEQTKTLVMKTQELMKTKIGNCPLISPIGLSYAKEAGLKWAKWDPSECEDVFDMNEECSDILCDIHHAIRIELYHCELLLALQGNDSMKVNINKCSDCLSSIDSLLDEYSFSA